MRSPLDVYRQLQEIGYVHKSVWETSAYRASVSKSSPQQSPVLNRSTNRRFSLEEMKDLIGVPPSEPVLYTSIDHIDDVAKQALSDDGLPYALLLYVWEQYGKPESPEERVMADRIRFHYFRTFV